MAPDNTLTAETLHAYSDTSGEEIRKALNLGGGVRWRRLLTWLVVLGGLGAGGVYLYQQMNQPPAPPQWVEAAATTGDIVTNVSATGTVEPRRIVEVGAEISGRVIAVEVDFNAVVEAGQVLVRLDTEPLEAELLQVQASLDAAKASVRQASASYTEAKQAETRTKALKAKGLATAAQTEGATASRARAAASLAAARAQQKVAEARVTSVETNLSKAVIKAPINGIVLTRQVEPGNAVAASLSTPVLFTIAEDLRHMELHLAIDEADVATVAAGMSATFTVDAYPDASFDATLKAVAYAATLNQNVVTYEAVLEVDNAELKLRPGMTATAAITTSAVRGVLRVPNAALRFNPKQQLAALSGEETGGRSASGGNPFMPTRRFGGGARGGRAGGAGRPDGAAGAAGAAGARGTRGARVWVLRDGEPTMVRIKTGATDGAWTEITDGELKAGDQLLVGLTAPEAS